MPTMLTMAPTVVCPSPMPAPADVLHSLGASRLGLDGMGCHAASDREARRGNRRAAEFHAAMTDDHRAQVLWLARELTDWESRYAGTPMPRAPGRSCRGAVRSTREVRRVGERSSVGAGSRRRRRARRRLLRRRGRRLLLEGPARHGPGPELLVRRLSADVASSGLRTYRRGWRPAGAAGGAVPAPWPAVEHSGFLFCGTHELGLSQRPRTPS
jgi:hypothetical protein